MRGELDRAKRIGIAAALCLAMLAVVAWLVLRAPSPSSVQARAAETRATVAERLDAPELAAPQIPRPGRRAPATAVPDVAPGVPAEPPSTEDDEDPPTTATIVLVGDVTGRPGDILGGPNTMVQLQGAGKTRAVALNRGSYRIEDNEPGEYELLCSAPGLRYKVRSITLSREETEHREDFVLDPVWTVAIRLVTDDGRNLLDPDVKLELPRESRVEVRASASPPPSIWWQQPSEQRTARRNYRWVPRLREDEEIPGDPEGACSGRLEIYGRPPVQVSVDIRGVVLASTRLDADATKATLEIPLRSLRGVACSLRCRVVAAEADEPIPNASVSVSLYRSTGGPRRLEADASGIIEQAGLLPGPCTLIFHADGRGTHVRRIQLMPSIDNDLGTIALGRELRIRGRFVDAEGRTVPSEACILPYPRDRPLEVLNSSMFFSAQTGTDGGFGAEALGPGEYVLLSNFLSQPTDEWWSAPVLVDLSRGSVEDLMVPVDRPVTVSLHPAQESVRDLAWWVLAPNGIVCARGEFADGRDTTVGLGPGNFRLIVGPDSEHVREIPFTVGESPTTIPIGP